jgi:hypothetical protein
MTEKLNKSTLFLAPFLLYFFISKEFIGVRLFMTKYSHDLLMMSIMAVIFIFYGFIIVRRRMAPPEPLRLSNYEKVFICLLLLWILLFIVHEILIGDKLRSIKYAMFMAALIFLRVYKTVNFPFIARFYIFFVCAVFLAAISGLALVFITKADPSSFAPLSAMYSVLNRPEKYVNPFGLGLITPDAKISYGPFFFYRVISFTTEAKFAAMLVLVMMVNVCIFLRGRLRSILLLISLVILIFVHSYAGLATLLLAAIFFILIRKFDLNPAIMTFFLLIMPAVIHVSTSVIYDRFYKADNYFMKRIYSVTMQAGGAEKKQKLRVMSSNTWIGITNPDHKQRVDYGRIGFLLKWLLFIVYSIFCFDLVNKVKSGLQKFAVILAIVSYYMFWLYFLSEFITPLAVLLMLTTFFLAQDKRLINDGALINN